MNPTATQSAHARSNSPLFDQLAAEIPSRHRPLSPITTSSLLVDRAVAPAGPLASVAPAGSVASASSAAPAASAAVAPARPAARRAAPKAELPSLASIVRSPLSNDDLTADERAIIDEMGGTVARLILQMLDDDTKSTRRWPFHPVK